MNFNEHSSIKDRHSFLSPSNYHWLNYSEEKLSQVYLTSLAREKGTRLHEFASEAIALGIKLPRTKKTLNNYINDAIGFRMTPEQPLYYSENCFGTADAISFRKKILRIHDLKTGVSPVSMKQLEIYAAIFCLEYSKDPYHIDILLRIYQMDEVKEEEPEPEVIKSIMNTIISFDEKIDQIRLEA